MSTSSNSTTTTAAPAETTTEPSATTTTAAPAETTTAAADDTTTTAGPDTTTTAGPDTTTTAGPDTTTTAAPAETTTAAASGEAPTVEEVTFAVDPDDGATHHPNSIQISTDAALTITWSTQNATSVRIDPLPGPFDASGSTGLPSEDATYTIVAVAEGGVESAPYTLEVHTHDPGEVVSAHVEVASGVAKVLSFTAGIDSAAAGASVELSIVATVDVESVKVADGEVELSETGDGHKAGTVTVTIPDGDTSVTFTCEASKDGATADTVTLTLQVIPSTTSTTVPGSTTTASSTTTTAAPGSSTTAPLTTSTATAPEPGATDPDLALRNLQWGAGAHTHGQPIELSAEADGVEDGRMVYFAIEQDEDASGDWQPLKEVQATFSAGKATVSTTLDDEEQPGDQHTHQYRFHASFTSSS